METHFPWENRFLVFLFSCFIWFKWFDEIVQSFYILFKLKEFSFPRTLHSQLRNIILSFLIAIYIYYIKIISYWTRSFAIGLENGSNFILFSMRNELFNSHLDKFTKSNGKRDIKFKCFLKIYIYTHILWKWWQAFCPETVKLVKFPLKNPLL